MVPSYFTFYQPLHRPTQQFFSFDSTRRHRPRKSLPRVKYDAVYHMLNCYPLEEIPQFSKPMPKVKGFGGGGKMDMPKVVGGMLPHMVSCRNGGVRKHVG